MKKKIFIFVVSFFVFLPLSSYERFIDFDLIKKAEAPRFVEDGVLITIDKNFGNVLYLRTDMDMWSKSYYFKKSQYGIFYLFLPIKKEVKSLKYRINVDGFWTVDPNNKNVIEDSVGIQLSYLELTEPIFFYREMPVIEISSDPAKKVYFRYYAPNAEVVTLVTSIDNFSPFSNRMIKNRYGYWEIEKYFANGTYTYYFFVDGKKVVDIENKNRGWDPLKGEVSFFVIK